MTQEFHFVVIHPSGSFYIVQGIILSITMSNEYHIKRSTIVPIFLCLEQRITLSPRPEVSISFVESISFLALDFEDFMLGWIEWNGMMD